jgi:hypothetical protein
VRIGRWLAELPEPVYLAVKAVMFAEWFIDRFGPAVARIDFAHATALVNRRGTTRTGPVTA